MDVTHIPEFRRNEYCHVTIDTYSGYPIATPLTGESTKFTIDHLFRCFATLDIPQIIKTANSPAYTSQAFTKFCLSCRIQHRTGIPYNPTGQAIVECYIRDIKALPQKQKKGGEERKRIRRRVDMVLYTIDFLTR